MSPSGSVDCAPRRFSECRIHVEAALLHRARWFIAQGGLTDDELTDLATGDPAQTPRSD